MVSYLIKSIVCSGILLAMYHLFLEREKMLRFNRFYLLFAIVFSLAIPLFSIEIPSERVASVLPADTFVQPPAPVQTPGPALPQATVPQNEWLVYIPWLMYAVVCTVLLGRFTLNTTRILQQKRGREMIRMGDATLVLAPGCIPSFTFLSYIFISEKTFHQPDFRDEILTHELAHAREKHTLDIIFIELVITFCWFNPLLLLFRKAIRFNHEYLADQAVLSQYKNVEGYQLLLLDTLLAERGASLASSFNYSVTQKRLAMMTRIAHPYRQIASKGFLLLLLPLLALAFADKSYSQQTGKKTPATRASYPLTDPKGAVSEAEMKDFFATIEKHKRYVTNKKGRVDTILAITPELENHLYATYTKMNQQQQQTVQKAGIGMYQFDIPVKQAPTPEVFENWKRPEVFGIWLNGKHVPNSALNQFKHSDIAEFSPSKLYGAARKGRIYKYQLDLTTNDHFDKTYDERVKNRVFIVLNDWFMLQRMKK